MSDQTRNRARIGGRAAAATNQRFHLRRVIDYERDGTGIVTEVLECGHRQLPRQDMAGEYPASRRRCHQCPKVKP